jgi:hypothetical protein
LLIFYSQKNIISPTKIFSMKNKFLILATLLCVTFFNAEAQRHDGKRAALRDFKEEKRHLQREKQIAHADGVVTRGERRILRQDKMRLQRKKRFLINH